MGEVFAYVELIQTPKDLHVQKYVAHEKTPTPLGPLYAPPRTQGISLRHIPRGVRFLASEVPS